MREGGITEKDHCGSAEREQREQSDLHMQSCASDVHGGSGLERKAIVQFIASLMGLALFLCSH